MPPTTRATRKPDATSAESGAEASESVEDVHSSAAPHALVIPLPRMPHLPHVGVPHVSRPHVPTPTMSGGGGRALWLGGLGALAVAGVIEWPVAGVVAAGVWVAEQRARTARAQRDERAVVQPLPPQPEP